MQNHLLFILKIMGSGMILIMVSRVSVQREFAAVLMLRGSPMTPFLPFESHMHPLFFLPRCAAPLAASMLPQSAPTLGRNGSAGGFYIHHSVAELTPCSPPRTGHKNTAEEEKREGAARLMACFDPLILFLPPQNG